MSHKKEFFDITLTSIDADIEEKEKSLIKLQRDISKLKLKKKKNMDIANSTELRELDALHSGDDTDSSYTSTSGHIIDHQESADKKENPDDQFERKIKYILAEMNITPPNTNTTCQTAATSAVTDAAQSAVTEVRRPVIPRYFDEGVSSSSSNSQSGKYLDFGIVEYAVPNFSGEDRGFSVNEFFQIFEDLMYQIKADNVFKLVSLRRKLRDTAACLIGVLEAITYEGLKAQLQKTFSEDDYVAGRIRCTV